jgi:KaiC/GvpD/RAD55 family RecA-like ATPase
MITFRELMVLTNFGLSDVPPHVVLLVEEDIGDTKTIFFRNIASGALKNGKTVFYITTKSSDNDIREQLASAGLNGSMDKLIVMGNFTDPVVLLDLCYKRRNLYNLFGHNSFPLCNMTDMDICIIDSFSSLFIHEELQSLTHALNALINLSRETNATFVLASDTGILSERAEKVVRSMVDGIIQFRTEYSADKISRYINIPKMKASIPPRKMMAYNITGQGIMVDNRERVG